MTIGNFFVAVALERPPQIPKTTLSELRFILNVKEGWPVCVPVTVCLYLELYSVTVSIGSC